MAIQTWRKVGTKLSDIYRSELLSQLVEEGMKRLRGVGMLE